MKTVIIIGGGLGGLFTAALLTKEGYRVTVLEKNESAGGGLRTFRRGGLVFETGMHMLGGLRPGGSVQKICSYLGFYDRLSLRAVDHDCMDSIAYLSDGKTYRIPEGREPFTDYFCSEFPNEAAGIRLYVDALYRLADEVALFNMRSGTDNLFSHSEQFLWAASELIAYFIKDVRLRDVLAYMNPMYGGVEDHTPAYIHALINVLYINGQDRFVGGSHQMSKLLVQTIEEGGGEVLTNQCVASLQVDSQRMCTSITTAAGRQFQGDYYISAIHPQRLVEIAGEATFPKSYRSRVAAIPNTYSAFSVYIKFKPQAFPYINQTCYLQDDYGSVWNHGGYDVGDSYWPHGLMYMTPPEKAQGRFASKMIVNCLMPFSAVEQWKDTVIGHRGKDYEAWKQLMAGRIIDRMEQLYPGFSSHVDQLWTSSPLTIRDYNGQPDGALYGVRKDCRNLMLSQLPIWTKVGNLLLTGQSINLHGICGVPLTAVSTAEAIVGQNILVEKINHYNDTYGKN